ncbi:hypothetical protein B4U79_02399 [Dinothrombium tinctorium]|nr:hypothetical protein B4U79_08697 [Dinothrombium tinctorium]RWS00028.1 hypothetical protein B4U79_10872 [Dinothrombium tinctorium]RWS00030.1 hypothetical protein B4U79_01395 [Dinothrombium tinctorium]RWS00031.1 hypothetical protein B4U79_07087 [Dinothrombium tinctorium]RWS00068.1 hypothetical protein B4U79_02399 [Dinothrombium tinctorium]
MTLRTDR